MEDADYAAATEMMNYLKEIKRLLIIAVSERKSTH
jgi:hypothetical protein